MKTLALFIYIFICSTSIIFAQNDKPLILQININQEINPTSQIFLSKGLAEAYNKKASAVLLHLNTYGGTVVDADSMRSAILYSKIPVYVFIDNNAASAGALIAIACKGIYMRKGANIGAATVVNETGEVMPDKYQSYMRSTIRATAEAQGKDTIINGSDSIFTWKRDPKIAEAMVDPSLYIPQVVDSGKVLSLTTEEAINLKYCDGSAESVDEVITKYLGYKDYVVELYKPSLYDKLRGFLLNPALQAILIMLIVAGIYFELQTPGMGFPSATALAAAIIYFTPLYMDGLAENWEIIIFVIGIILIFFEIFVIPGFGIAGISGIACISLGLILAMINNDYFSFEHTQGSDITRSVLTVFSGLTLGFFFLIFLSSRIGAKGMFQKFALETDLHEASVKDSTFKNFIGSQAEVISDLRPSGKVMIENEIYDAIALTGFIEKGQKVRIVKTDNAQLYVSK
ncbi:serine protease [Bacteroidales bacterium]|nr:serine protease [Bacteroidales bacterium]